MSRATRGVGQHHAIRDYRMLNTYEQTPDNQFGDSLLTSYKRVNQDNNDRLKNVKNLEDLVAIDIAAASPQRGRFFENPDLHKLQEEQIVLDLKYDPLNYKQRMPLFNERERIVTNSILYNSSQCGAFRSQPRSTRHHRKNLKNPLLPKISSQQQSNQASETDNLIPSVKHLRKDPHQYSASATENQLSLKSMEKKVEARNDEMNKSNPVKCLQQLFGRNKEEPRKIRKVGTNHIMNKYKELERKRVLRETKLAAEENNFASENCERMSKSTAPNSGLMLDSLNEGTSRFGYPKFEALKSNTATFGKNLASPISKIPRSDQKKGIVSGIIEHPVSAPHQGKRHPSVPQNRPNFDIPSQQRIASAFAEEESVARATNSSFKKPDEVISTETTQVIHSTISGTDQVDQKQMQKDLQNAFGNKNIVHLASNDALGQAQTTNPLMHQKYQIREKLVQIRKLFENEEHLQDAIEREQQEDKFEKAAYNVREYDLDGHKTMYQEAIETRKRQLDAFTKINLPYKSCENGENAKRSPAKHLQPGDFKASDFDCEDEKAVEKMKVAETDMREFLVQRILQLKMQTFGKDKVEVNNTNRYKFKASTLFNLQPAHERKKYVKQLTGEHINETLATDRTPYLSVVDSYTQQKSREVSGQLDSKPSMANEISVIKTQVTQEKSLETDYQPPSGTDQQMEHQEQAYQEEEAYYEEQQLYEEAQDELRMNMDFIKKLSFTNQEELNEVKKLESREKNFYLQCMFALSRWERKQDKIVKAQRKAMVQPPSPKKYSRLRTRNIQQSKMYKTEADKTTTQYQSSKAGMQQQIEHSDSGKFGMNNRIELAIQEANQNELRSEEKQTLVGLNSKIGVGTEQDGFEIGNMKENGGTQSAHGDQTGENTNRDINNFLQDQDRQKPRVQTTARRTKVNNEIDYADSHEVGLSAQYSRDTLNKNKGLSLEEQSQGAMIQRDSGIIDSEVSPKNYNWPRESAILPREGVTPTDEQNIQTQQVNLESDKETRLASRQDDQDKQETTEESKMQPFPALQVETKTNTDREGTIELLDNDDVGVEIYSINDHFTVDMKKSDLIDPSVRLQPENQQKKVQNGDYFCPKRYNRFPRFSMFFKKTEEQVNSQYDPQNTVSLSPEFLTMLMENKDQGLLTAIQNQQNIKGHLNANARIQASLKSFDGEYPISSYEQDSHAPDSKDGHILNSLNDKRDFSTALDANSSHDKYTPHNVVIQNYDIQKKQPKDEKKNYDPFEKVILIKGIDNSILTSYRTLKGDNNTVSDTFKIVHGKFASEGMQSQSFYKKLKVQRAGNQLYPETVLEQEYLSEEDAIDGIPSQKSIERQLDTQTSEGIVINQLISNEATQQQSLKIRQLADLTPQAQVSSGNVTSHSPHLNTGQTPLDIDIDPNKNLASSKNSGPLPTDRSLNQELANIKKDHGTVSSKNQMPAIPTANLEMSSQIILDDETLSKDKDKSIDKYASSHTWQKKSPAIEKVIINEQAQGHVEYSQEKVITNDNETIIAGKEGKGTIQQFEILVPSKVQPNIQIPAKSPQQRHVFNENKKSEGFSGKKQLSNTDLYQATKIQQFKHANKLVPNVQDSVDLEQEQLAMQIENNTSFAHTGRFFNNTRARLPAAPGKKRTLAQEKDGHGRSIQGHDRKFLRRRRSSQQVDILSSNEKTRAAREIETKQHLTANEIAHFTRKIQQVTLASGAQILTSTNAAPYYQSNITSLAENLQSASDFPMISQAKLEATPLDSQRNQMQTDRCSQRSVEELSESNVQQNTVSVEASQQAIRHPVLTNENKSQGVNMIQQVVGEQTKGTLETHLDSGRQGSKANMKKISKPEKVKLRKSHKSASPEPEQSAQPSPRHQFFIPGSEVKFNMTEGPPEVRQSDIEKVVRNLRQKKPIGEIYDQLYQKERKYVSNADKDNFLNSQSPIFELQKYHNLRSKCLESVTEERRVDNKSPSDNTTYYGSAVIKQSVESPKYKEGQKFPPHQPKNRQETVRHILEPVFLMNSSGRMINSPIVNAATNQSQSGQWFNPKRNINAQRSSIATGSEVRHDDGSRSGGEGEGSIDVSERPFAWQRRHGSTEGESQNHSRLEQRIDTSNVAKARASIEHDEQNLQSPNKQIPHLDLHPASGAQTNTVQVLEIQTINKASNPELRQNIELNRGESNIMAKKSTQNFQNDELGGIAQSQDSNEQ